MATQMIASISEAFNVRFSAVDFFARPTVAALAERIEALKTAQEAVGTLPAEVPPPAAEGAPLG
jgi:hypothetical protein